MDLRLHEHQADRLASLRSCQVHDSAQEETFKMLTGLTARERRAPISMIVLVDHDPQWFLSRHRAGRTGGPRSASVCSHVVAGGAAIGLQSRGRGSVLVALASNTLVGASDATPAMPRTRSGEGAGSW